MMNTWELHVSDLGIFEPALLWLPCRWFLAARSKELFLMAESQSFHLIHIFLLSFLSTSGFTVRFRVGKHINSLMSCVLWGFSWNCDLNILRWQGNRSRIIGVSSFFPFPLFSRHDDDGWPLFPHLKHGRSLTSTLGWGHCAAMWPSLPQLTHLIV